MGCKVVVEGLGLNIGWQVLFPNQLKCWQLLQEFWLQMTFDLVLSSCIYHSVHVGYDIMYSGFVTNFGYIV